MTRGAWAALEIISEYTEHSVKSRSGWVSWKYCVPICSLGMCEAIARTGTRERFASYRPLMRCRLPGPHDPAHTARVPVSSASAAAAHLHPLDTLGAPHCVDHRVEAVAHDAVDAAHPCGNQLTHQLIGNGTGAGHECSSGLRRDPSIVRPRLDNRCQWSVIRGQE